MNQDEIKQLVLDYVSKEYLDDEDEKITFDTPLISAVMSILLQWFHCSSFLSENSK